MGIHQLWIESDSQVAIHMVSSGCEAHHPLDPLVNRVRELLGRTWRTKISHCYREGNMVADKLVRLGNIYPNWELQVFMDPHEECLTLLNRDLMGFARPRLCSGL
ncbi:uncharacterized protein LOC133314954 [Gastrolobium bilobum]|uniref:uncharacterized protein LOC133314954 n=1 Tax=Gastrolobium bilobum TaxID=150636 RepID=UPI002AAFB02C|nr:uncharacterized protein LOC133314954 [Gastrolobium bilobum]